ncbi:MAG: HAD hydrolase-like protein, partial [Oscillospiraceae bacterium]
MQTREIGGGVMRLQGAIFDGTDLLCDGAGKPRPGVSEFLSLLKMDGVWLYLVTAGERSEAEGVLSRAGLGERFRGVLSAGEVRGGIEDVYERAVRRLQTAKPTVVVFTADLERLPVLYAADFR